MTLIVAMIYYEDGKLISIPKGSVYWDKLGNDTSTQMQHLAANDDVTNVHSLFYTLGIHVGAFGWVCKD